MSTILVVDDMAIFRDPLAASLRLAGYQTQCAENGREALARVAAGRPDLILLDLAMPVLDGLGFLRALRADAANARIPVIVLTAAAERENVMEAAGLGAREYMLKSRLSMKDMLERVKRRMADDQVGAVSPAGGATARAGRGAGTGAGRIAGTNAVTAPVVSFPASVPAPPATPTMAVGDLPRRMTKEQCVERAEGAMQAKTMSGVVMQVISQAASPHSDANQLAALVGRDPMLSARVLQAANSAAYATGRGVITNITEAVRHIGCSTIRNIATAVGIFDAMPETSPDGFNPIRCWQHSFAVARLCERLSASASVGAVAVVGGGEKDDEPAGPAPTGGTAYLVGLCHDVGEILFHTQFADEYREVMELRQRSGLPQDRVERAVLGMTHGELVTTILRCLGLPSEILGPIEAAHVALARNADPRDRMARTLRLAEYYANGLLLASGGGGMVAALTQVECRAACGQAEPARPDGVALRAEILALTGMLSGMGRGDGERLMAPLKPRGELRVWLAREGTLSGFDPLAAALDAMAHVEAHGALPGPGEWADCDALVVATRSPATAGFTSGEIERCVSARADGRPTPVLWLSGTEARGLPADALPVRRWPISLDELHHFLTAAEAASPAARAAHESRIRAALGWERGDG
jgi:CheY-like chemotaxis protein